ncbi:MAG: hypothetical protein ACKKMV_02215 [Candidatus Nealsonbacteria bacterium]
MSSGKPSDEILKALEKINQDLSGELLISALDNLKNIVEKSVLEDHHKELLRKMFFWKNIRENREAREILKQILTKFIREAILDLFKVLSYTFNNL